MSSGIRLNTHFAVATPLKLQPAQLMVTKQETNG